MKSKKNQNGQEIITSLLKLMNDKGITQETIAKYAEIDPSQMSKIIKGRVQISIAQVANIASNLNMRTGAIFDYPDIYDKKVEQQETTRFLLDIEVQNGKVEVNQFCLNNNLAINN